MRIAREDDEQRRPLDDETPGSQGEIDPGSEGDFGKPPSEEGEDNPGSEDHPPTV